MKKKVLTSAMALAMLAPTVSAFATPQDVTVSGSQQSAKTPWFAKTNKNKTLAKKRREH